MGGAFGGVFGGEGGLVSLLVFGVAVDPPGGVVGGEPAGRVGLGGDRWVGLQVGDALLRGGSFRFGVGDSFA